MRTDTHLDELKRHDDDALRRAGAHAGQQAQVLGHLVRVEQGPVGRPPKVVGGELDRPFGSFEHQRGHEASVQPAEAASGVSGMRTSANGGRDRPFGPNDLLREHP